MDNQDERHATASDNDVLDDDELVASEPAWQMALPVNYGRRSPVTAPLNPADAPDIPSTSEDIDEALAASLPEIPTAEIEIPDIQVPIRTVSDPLPEVAPNAELARPPLPWRWKALCFTITLAIYLAFLPRFFSYSSPPTGDQPFYLMDTISLVQDGDLNVANNYTQHDEDKFYKLAPHPADFMGMDAPYPLPPQLAPSSARPATEWYSFHLPGLPVLMIPSWVIGGLFQLWWPGTLVFMCIIAALTSLNIFLLAYETTGKAWIAWAVWLPLAFSNPIWSYAYMIFTELTVGLFAVYAFRRLAMGWSANGPLRILLVGTLVAYIPWLAWRCVVIAAPLALYGAFQWYREYRVVRKEQARLDATDEQKEAMATGFLKPLPAPNRATLLKPMLFLGPMVVSAILIAGYNIFLFGKPLPDMKVPELGDASPFHWPWQGGDQAVTFVTNAFGLLFDRQMGLLTSAPIYLLAAVGIIAMFRMGRKADLRLLLWMGIVILPYAGLLAAFNYWNGLWCPPARYLTSLVPLLAAPLAMSLFALSRGWVGWVYRIVYALLSLPGIFLMIIRLIDARLLWPGNSTWEWFVVNPESPFKVELRYALPSFSPLEAIRLPADTAWLTAVCLGIVLLFYFFLLRSRAGRPQRRLPYLAHAAIWGVALAVVWGGWYTVNAEFLKPRTILSQVGVWAPSQQLVHPMGIAYKDNSVYVTDFNGQGPGDFLRLDLSRSTFDRIPATYNGAPAAYASPAGVAVGPDGLLYVLNNGQGEDALWVMQPEGQIVRKIVLNGKTLLSAGIAFGPDNTMYIGDITGSKALKYSIQGGDPLMTYTGVSGSFNNLLDVELSPDKKLLYAADASARRVQILDATTGAFIREIKVDCDPHYIAIPPTGGDTVEVSCGDRGIFTLNTANGNVQRIRTETGDENITAVGATYGSDGILYTVNGGQVVAFRVQH